MEAWNEAHPDDQITLLDPQYGRTTTDTGRATAEAILDANPDIDALIVAGDGGDTLLGAIAGIEARGLTGKIAVVSTDFLPDLDVKLQTGAMAAESGGHYADPFFAFLMVYNAIKGNYATSTEGFYDMVFPYMFVASPEDYANYAEYFTGAELPYYEDEIANLAGLSYDDLAAFVNVIKVGSITSTAGNQLETQILISLVLGGLPITGHPAAHQGHHLPAFRGPDHRPESVEGHQINPFHKNQQTAARPRFVISGKTFSIKAHYLFILDKDLQSIPCHCPQGKCFLFFMKYQQEIPFTNGMGKWYTMAQEV